MGMDTALLTLRHVEVFRAVMRTGSVSQAAVLLNTSQPTISRELARMVRLSGLHLFERSRGRLQPTRQARLLLEEVERAYSGMERIRQAVGDILRYRDGRLSILCQPGLAQSLLPAACLLFRAEGRDASLCITPQDPPMLGEWLAAQRFDLGVLEGEVAVPGVDPIALFSGEEVCILPPAHPLAARKALGPADLQGQNFVCLAESDPLRQRVDSLFRQAGVSYRPVMETHSSAAVCAMVAQGLGIAVVNPLMAWAQRTQGIQMRRFAPIVPYSVMAAVPRYRDVSDATTSFVHALRQSGQTLAVEIERALAA